MTDTKKSHGAIATPKRFFHAASWLGLATTAYTNYESAPNVHLRVAYLAIPLLAACLSEGLIRGWKDMHMAVRASVSLVLTGLLITSYEHFQHLIFTSGGTEYSSIVGAAMVDAAILACIIATATMSDEIETTPEMLYVAPEPQPLPEPKSELKSEPKSELKSEPKSLPSPKPSVGGKREAAKQADIDAMLKIWPDLEFLLLPGKSRHSDVMKEMNCGGSRATRLINVFTEYLENEFKGASK
jgi:hypothetical protein